MGKQFFYQKSTFLNALSSFALTAFGVMVAAHTSDSIYYQDGTALLWAVAVLSVLNVIIKPILMFLAMPFILITLGLGTWVINALLFKWVGNFVDGFFVVTWSGAFWGAFMVSLTNMLANWSSERERYVVTSNKPTDKIRKHHRRQDDDDVIDI